MKNADSLVIPGVGSFGVAMNNLTPFSNVINEHVDESPQGRKSDFPVHYRAKGIDDQEDQDGSINHDEVRIEQFIPEALAF